MKKTLLSALKHGSGILLALFSLLFSCQVWAGNPYLSYYDLHVSANGGDDETMNSSSTSYDAGDVRTLVITQFHGNISKNGGNVCGCVLKYRRKNTSTSSWVDGDWVTVNRTGQNWDKDPVEFWGTDLSVNVLSGLDYGSYTLYAKVSGTGDSSSGQCGQTQESSEMTVTFTKVPVEYAIGGWLNDASVSTYDASTWGLTESSGTYTGRFVFSAVHENAEWLWILGNDNSTWGVSSDTEISLGGNVTITKGYTGGKVKAPAVVGTEYAVTFTPVSETSGTLTWNYGCDNPTVSTTSSPSTTAVSASCAGTYSTGGDYCAPISGGIAYKKGSDDYSDQAGTVSAGAISASLSGLIPGTTYTYKAYVVLDNNTRIEGSEQTFTTGCPTISIPSGPSTSDVSYCDGSVVAALAVTATSSPDYTMEYQWYSSADKSDDDIISGATESTYTPSSGTLYYRCKVRTNSACDASAQTSAYSGRITFDPEKVSPVITASASSVTNYTPVTLTASKAVIETWALSGSGVNQYLYKKTGTSAVFKGNVGSGSAVTYTIEGTAANGCSGTTTVTVNKNADSCE